MSCRCIELELWEGQTGSIEIAHGKSIPYHAYDSTKLDLADVVCLYGMLISDLAMMMLVLLG